VQTLPSLQEQAGKMAQTTEGPSNSRNGGPSVENPKSALPSEPWRPKVNPWLIAVVVAMAAFMEVLDTSIANVALPYMAGNLGASNDESTWVLTSYLVSNAIVLPISGWLASALGRKRFFMICLVVFTVSSLLCGFAPSLGAIIFFRVLQGAGGGGADSFYHPGITGPANPADPFAGGGWVDSLAGTACCRRRGSIRSANCRHDVGEWCSTHLHLQPWGFSSLCGINRRGAHLAGGYRGGRFLTRFLTRIMKGRP